MAASFGRAFVMTSHAIDSMTGLGEYQFMDSVMTNLAIKQCAWYQSSWIGEPSEGGRKFLFLSVIACRWYFVHFRQSTWKSDCLNYRDLLNEKLSAKCLVEYGIDGGYETEKAKTTPYAVAVVCPYTHDIDHQHPQCLVAESLLN
ncbi:hypothetical protein AZE42_07493, partial [Rhizopogon vesiculosus]